MTVSGDGRSTCRNLFPLTSGDLPDHAFLYLGKLVFARIGAQSALGAVEQDEVPGLEGEHGTVNAADSRDTKRTGKNGNMSSRSTGCGAETEDLAAIERGRVGGAELLGNED